MRPCLLCEERGTIADRRCPYCKGKGQKPDVASDEVLKANGIDPEIPKLFDELNRKKRKLVLWLHEQKADPDVIDTVLRM